MIPASRFAYAGVFLMVLAFVGVVVAPDPGVPWLHVHLLLMFGTGFGLSLPRVFEVIGLDEHRSEEVPDR